MTKGFPNIGGTDSDARLYENKESCFRLGVGK